MSENMRIWDRVKETDREYTKERQERGRKLTSITPQYQLQEATKVFGPYGKGFGFESCNIELGEVAGSMIAIIRAVFFYVDSDGRHTFPINNSWDIMAGKRDSKYLDVEYAKKAETNTLSKALSKLGFSADVFMGQFDDVEYVAQIEGRQAIEKAEDKLEEERKQKLEYQQKCKNEIEKLSTATNLSELKHLFTEYTRRANLWQDKDQIKRLDAAKNKRKEGLEQESPE